MTDFSCAILVNPRGQVLMQERDEHAPVFPGQWGLPGGAIEPGETPLQACAREIEEETELVVPHAALGHYGDYDVRHPGADRVDRMSLFTAAVDATDDDVVCHEGRQMVFVDRDVVMTLDLAPSSGAVLPGFFGTSTFAELRGSRH